MSTAQPSREQLHAATIIAIEAQRAKLRASPNYTELRRAGVAPPPQAKTLATSKTVYTREALREAARRSLSAQAQAVFAILIAESWWDERRSAWRLRMSQQQLASRLSASVDSVKRWLRELAGAQLVEVLPGRARTVNRYVLASLAQPETAAAQSLNT